MDGKIRGSWARASMNGEVCGRWLGHWRMWYQHGEKERVIGFGNKHWSICPSILTTMIASCICLLDRVSSFTSLSTLKYHFRAINLLLPSQCVEKWQTLTFRLVFSAVLVGQRAFREFSPEEENQTLLSFEVVSRETMWEEPWAGVRIVYVFSIKQNQPGFSSVLFRNGKKGLFDMLMDLKWCTFIFFYVTVKISLI